MKKNYRPIIFILLTLVLTFSGIYAQSDSLLSQQLPTIDEWEEPAIVSCDCSESEARCTGTIIWSDGSKYEGQFEYGIIQGTGKLTLGDQSTYEGAFVEEVFHGDGTLTYPDGSKYIGNWDEGYKEGEGAYIYPDGSEYLGTFQGDQMHGDGAMIMSDGTIYSGTWENGLIQGYATIIRTDGSTFFGMNKGGDLNGPGYIVWESGDTLFGNWTDGVIDQDAFFQFEDGTSIICHWKNGTMSDSLQYIKSDGFGFTAPPEELINLVLRNDFDLGETREQNFELAFYAIGMEYKSMMDYEKASELFQFAMNISGSMEESVLEELIETQMANIETEQKNSQVASKKNKKPN